MYKYNYKIFFINFLLLSFIIIFSHTIKAQTEGNKFYRDLYESAFDGNLQNVKSILKRGANVNSSDDRGVTILMTAAFRKKLDVVKYLVLVGADINLESKYGKTALFYGTGENGFEIIKFLIEHRAKVNIINSKGQTPLSKIIGSGEFEQMKLLIEHGANVNVEDEWGKTPLMNAADSADISLVQLLLEKGAKVNVVEKGVTFTNFNPRQTALRAAVKSHRPDVVKLLLDYGANAHIPDDKNRTPVQWAELLKYKDILKIFSDYNVLKPKT